MRSSSSLRTSTNGERPVSAIEECSHVSVRCKVGEATDMSVVDWLLDSDPSIRWQVMRDLTGEPDDVIAAERASVAPEGWGNRLLDLQHPLHQWSGRVA